MQNNKYPTFKDSPAFKWFPHWQSDDGLIDAIDVRIYHNYEFDEYKEILITAVSVSL